MCFLFSTSRESKYHVAPVFVAMPPLLFLFLQRNNERNTMERVSQRRPQQKARRSLSLGVSLFVDGPGYQTGRSSHLSLAQPVTTSVHFFFIPSFMVSMACVARGKKGRKMGFWLAFFALFWMVMMIVASNWWSMACLCPFFFLAFYKHMFARESVGRRAWQQANFLFFLEQEGDP